MAWVHDLSPILISIGPLAIRYYSLAYLLPLLALIPWLKFANKKGWISLDKKQIDNVLLYMTLGVMLGGRLGYMLFYDITNLFSLQTFMIWQGGMSFHGGLIGVSLALYIFCKKHDVNILSLADVLVLPGTFGLILGRIANFINGELWGTPSSTSWCVFFPNAPDLGTVCRHPSQLYEATYTTIILGVTSYLQIARQQKAGTVFAAFLILYGILRFTTNFVRDDPILLLGISMGQLLSILTALAGAVLLYKVQKQ